MILSVEGGIVLTIEQRRKTDRKRRERWRKNKLAQGCKQIQLMLAPEAQAILKHEKSRTGEPYVQIIHRAIIELDKDLPITSFKNKAQHKKKARQQGQLKLF